MASNRDIGSIQTGGRDIGSIQSPSSQISVALAGSITSSTEADIAAGGRIITLTLTNDTWVAAGGTFDAVRQAIITGLDSNLAEGTGWDAEVRDKEVVSAVVRTSNTVVTITLTSVSSAYDITADEIITATVPASALVTSVIAVQANPTFTVTAIIPTITAIDSPVTDGLTGNSLSVTDYTSDINSLTIEDVGSTHIATMTIQSGTGDGPYTWDVPDVSAYTANTLGTPFDSASWTHNAVASDGTDSDTNTIVLNPKTGWDVIEVLNAVTTQGSVFEGWVSTPSDTDQVYYPTADNTSVDADGTITTDQTTGSITMQFFDILDSKWKTFDFVLGSVLNFDRSFNTSYLGTIQSAKVINLDTLGTINVDRVINVEHWDTTAPTSFVKLTRPWETKPDSFVLVDINNPLNDGLQGRWLMNEAGGDITKDISGNGRDGTLLGEPVQEVTAAGRSLYFDATNDRVDVVSRLDSGLVYTLVTWISFESDITGSNHIAGFGTAAGSSSSVRFDQAESSGSVGFDFWNSSLYGSTNANTLLIGTGWNCIVAEFHDNDFLSNRIWINNIEQSLSQLIGTGANRTLDTKFGFASNGWTDNFKMRGSIGDMGVYNRVLSDNERTELYNNPYETLTPRTLWVPAAATVLNFDRSFNTSYLSSVESDRVINVEHWFTASSGATILKLIRPHEVKPDINNPSIDWNNSITEGLNFACVHNLSSHDLVKDRNIAVDQMTDGVAASGRAKRSTIASPARTQWDITPSEFIGGDQLTVLSFYKANSINSTNGTVNLAGVSRSGAGWRSFNLIRRGDPHTSNSNNVYLYLFNSSDSGVFSQTIKVDNTEPHISVGRYDGANVDLFHDGDFKGGNAQTGNIQESQSLMSVNGEYTNSGVTDIDIYLTLVWRRALSDNEIESISANPWQILEPRTLWVPVGVTILNFDRSFNTSYIGSHQIDRLTNIEYSNSNASIRSINVEHLGSTSSTRILNYDFSNANQSDRVVNTDFSGTHEVDRVVNVEHLGSVQKASILNYSFLETLQSDRQVNTSFLGTLQSDRIFVYDNGGTLVLDFDRILNYDFSGTHEVDRVVNVDFSGTNQTDRTLNYSHLNAVQPESVSNYDFSGTHEVDRVVNVEHGSSIESSRQTNYSHLAGIQSTTSLNYSFLNSLQSSGLFNYSNLGTTEIVRAINVAFSGNITSDKTIVTSFLGSLQKDIQLNASYGHKLEEDRVFVYDNLGLLVTFIDRTFNYDFSGLFELDRIIHASYLNDVLVDQVIGFSNYEGVVSDNVIPTDFSGTLSVDSVVLVDNLSSINIDREIIYHSNLGIVSAFHRTFNYDWVNEVSSDRTIQVEFEMIQLNIINRPQDIALLFVVPSRNKIFHIE